MQKWCSVYHLSFWTRLCFKFFIDFIYYANVMSLFMYITHFPIILKFQNINAFVRRFKHIWNVHRNIEWIFFIGAYQTFDPFLRTLVRGFCVVRFWGKKVFQLVLLKWETVFYFRNYILSNHNLIYRNNFVFTYLHIHFVACINPPSCWREAFENNNLWNLYQLVNRKWRRKEGRPTNRGE